MQDGNVESETSLALSGHRLITLCGLLKIHLQCQSAGVQYGQVRPEEPSDADLIDSGEPKGNTPSTLKKTMPD